MQNKDYEQITENIMSLFPLFRRLLKSSEEDKCTKIPNPQYPVLGILSVRGALPMSEIGMRLGISKPNMTVIIDYLIAEKNVKRIDDEKDRRIVMIDITEKGREALKGARELLKNELKKKLLILNEKDLVKMLSSLKNLKEVLSKIDSSTNKDNKGIKTKKYATKEAKK